LTHLFQLVSLNRLYDEILKLFFSGVSFKIFRLLCSYQLFEPLFPLTYPYLGNKQYKKFIELVLKSTDERIKQHKPVIAAFFFAALLWFPFIDIYSRQLQEHHMTKDINFAYKAIHEIFHKQSRYFSMTQYVKKTIEAIFYLQITFHYSKQKEMKQIFRHPRFRAAFDFLLLRAKIDKSLTKIVKRWKKWKQLIQE